MTQLPVSVHRFTRGRPASLVLALAAALQSTGCAVPTTQVGQISRSALLEEQATQQRYVLESRLRQQARLQTVAAPLLKSALPMCGRDVARRMGVFFANAPSFGKEWRDAAVAIGFSDTVSLSQVLPGSGAEQAGLQRGDRILAIDDTPVPVGANAIRDLNAWMTRREKESPAQYRITYRRDLTTATVSVPTQLECSYPVVSVTMDDLNAFADGQNVYVTTGMMRFAVDDAELSTIVGHEIGHNAMHHMDAMKRNMAIGMVLGAIVDIAAAKNGVNTRGDFTKQFAELGAMVFSQDFEREADYVGLYVVARSGRPVTNAAELWRHMAAENPKSIRFASSHPTTAERFLHLRQYASEIEAKQLAGLALMPELRNPASGLQNPGGRVLAAAGKRTAGAVKTTTAVAAPPAAPMAPTSTPPGEQAARSPRTSTSKDSDSDARRATTPDVAAIHAGSASSAASDPVERGSGAGGALLPVRVLVRVPDWIVGSFQYLRDYPVLVVGPAHDSTVVRTDTTGTATFGLRAGHYRIAPCRGDGVAARQRYEWDLAFDVTGSGTTIELTEANGRRRGR